MITTDALREMLHYNPETGEVRWLKSRRGRQLGGPKSNDRHGYPLICIDYRLYRIHRLVWFYMTGAWPEKQIDHVNGDRADNRWANLREASRSENLGNMKRRSDNSTGFKGVCRDKRGKTFCFAVQCAGRRIRRSGFATASEAHAAYMTAARQLFGEFARAA